jgi:hypothetical protein
LPKLWPHYVLFSKHVGKSIPTPRANALLSPDIVVGTEVLLITTEMSELPGPRGGPIGLMCFLWMGVV